MRDESTTPGPGGPVLRRAARVSLGGRDRDEDQEQPEGERPGDDPLRLTRRSARPRCAAGGGAPHRGERGRPACANSGRPRGRSRPCGDRRPRRRRSAGAAGASRSCARPAALGGLGAARLALGHGRRSCSAWRSTSASAGRGARPAPLDRRPARRSGSAGATSSSRTGEAARARRAAWPDRRRGMRVEQLVPAPVGDRAAPATGSGLVVRNSDSPSYTDRGARFSGSWH